MNEGKELKIWNVVWLAQFWITPNFAKFHVFAYWFEVIRINKWCSKNVDIAWCFDECWNEFAENFASNQSTMRCSKRVRWKSRKLLCIILCWDKGMAFVWVVKMSFHRAIQTLWNHIIAIELACFPLYLRRHHLPSHSNKMIET